MEEIQCKKNNDDNRNNALFISLGYENIVNISIRTIGMEYRFKWSLIDGT